MPRRSLSALTGNLLSTTRGFALSRHTVFFADDSCAEFDDMFEHARLPSSPTVYVCACAQDRRDVERDCDDVATPAGVERLLLIVNAPATGDARPFTAEKLARCGARTFRTMARCGLRVMRNPEHTLMTTPHDFGRLFPGDGRGAVQRGLARLGGFVPATGRAQPAIEPLYRGWVGAPGAGGPMAALSGRQAAASVLADRDSSRTARRPSTSPLRPTAKPGGTSMR